MNINDKCPDCGAELEICELPGCCGCYCCTKCEWSVPDGEY